MLNACGDNIKTDPNTELGREERNCWISLWIINDFNGDLLRRREDTLKLVKSREMFDQLSDCRLSTVVSVFDLCLVIVPKLTTYSVMNANPILVSR